MDKSKVLIMGESAHGKWLAEAMGKFPDLFEVEVRPYTVGTIGHKSSVFVLDDLVKMDFSGLEDLVVSGIAGRNVLFDGAHLSVEIITHRQMYKEPEPQRLPRTHTQQSIYEMLAMQTGRRITPDMEKSNRLFAMGYNPSLMICDEYTCMSSKPADHPSRKREPKGPRNKWGKIK